MTGIGLERPWLLWIGLPVALVVLVAFALSLRRAGQPRGRVAALTALRAGMLVLLVLLAARPVWTPDPSDAADRSEVVLLVDRSRSMSLVDEGRPRYAAAVEFVGDRLAPALNEAGLAVRSYLFAEDATAADGPAIATADPSGSRTDLAAALARSLSNPDDPPLAVLVLSDGVATERARTGEAVSALVGQGVPVVAVGFGRDEGSRTLSLAQIVSPSAVPPGQEFRISASLQSTGEEELPAFDLLLLRDGRLRERKRVPAGPGARVWLESFTLTEDEPGTHRYTVRVLPPDEPTLTCPDIDQTVGVRVTDERDLDVLFVQGGLTWDYKFIGLAVRGDPTIQLTGLSRTASGSMLMQSLGEGDAPGGFPDTIERLAEYRVVVLANLSPTDLTPAQQELLAEFCREYGGGVLLMGGPETFHAGWQSSRLEELLPVRFAGLTGGPPPEPFRFELTDEATRHAVFQIAPPGENERAWAGVPPFRAFAPVEAVKPAARVWAVHPNPLGQSSNQPRPLMAVQRYGAGLSAVIGVQNFWRWRLAKESRPEHFDRFWRQLLRFLGEGASESVVIRLADGELRPDRPLRVILEPRPDAALPAGSTQRVTMRLAKGDKTVHEQAVELTAGTPTPVDCPLAGAGLYTVSVLDGTGIVVSTRTVDVPDPQWEFLRTGRDMDALRQWARLSQGIAHPAEDCPPAAELIAGLQEQSREALRQSPTSRPLAAGWWPLVVLLALLCGEYALRRRWGLT
jgi:hypothetical protein